MGVDVDEAGHDHAALGVHKLRVGILGLQVGQGAHFLDNLAVQRYGAVLQIGQSRIPGNQFSVSNQQHVQFLLL